MPALLDGLHVFRDFATAAERLTLFDAASTLSQSAASLSRATAGAPIASTAHNVNSEERFKSLLLPLPEGGTATCEHFDHCERLTTRSVSAGATISLHPRLWCSRSN